MFDPEAEGWKAIPVKAFFRRIGPLYSRRLETGEWAYGLLTTDEHDNSAGAVHGGVLAAFADQAFSTVAWEAAGRRAASTVSLDMHFAAAVRPGTFVTTHAQVVRAASTLIFLTGLLHSDTQDVAIASGTWRVAR